LEEFCRKITSMGLTLQLISPQPIQECKYQVSSYPCPNSKNYCTELLAKAQTGSSGRVLDTFYKFCTNIYLLTDTPSSFKQVIALFDVNTMMTPVIEDIS
jgi:hypothetical protein